MPRRVTSGPWWLWLRVAASTLMLLLLLPRINLGSILPGLDHASTFGYLVLGLLATLGGLILSAWRWQRVLSVLQVRARMSNLVSHYLAGQFVGNFLPSTIGGDVLRVSRLSASAPGTAPFTSVVLERLTGWIVLPLLTFAGLLLSPSLLRLGMASRLAVGLSVGTLCLLAGLLAVAGSRRLAGRFAKNDGWTRFIGAVHMGIQSLRRRPAEAVGVLGVAIVYQLSMVGVVYLATRALGLDLPLPAVLAFAPVVAMAQVLPLSLNGLGVREAAFVLLLGPLGVGTGQAVAVGLLVYAMTLMVSLLGAPAFAVGGRGRAPVPA